MDVIAKKINIVLVAFSTKFCESSFRLKSRTRQTLGLITAPPSFNNTWTRIDNLEETKCFGCPQVPKQSLSINIMTNEMDFMPSTNDQSCSLDSSLAKPLLPLHDEINDNTFDLLFEEGPPSDDEYYSFPSLYRGSRSNLRRILAATWFGFTGRAIWSQTVLPILIYRLYPQQLERVGYVTAAMGVSQVTGSLVTRYCLARIWKRHELLQLASVTALWSLIVLSDTVLFQVDWSWLVQGLCAWGFTWGIMDVAMPSLFADSLPETEETRYYTRASRLLRFANTLGPTLVFALFCFVLRDEWTVVNCSIVFAIGLGFCLPMVFLLCCLHEVEDESPEEMQFHDSPQSEGGCGPQGKMDMAGDVTEETAAISATLELSQPSSVESPTGRLSSPKTMVPPLLLVSCILSGAASGISIRYFPIFFVKEMELNAAFLQALYVITPLGQALVKYSSKYMARCCGASCVTVALQWAFVGILLSMVLAYKQGMSVWIVSAAYLGHAFLMNSSTALTQSIMLSTVSDRRAKILAFGETFQLLLWSTGAAAGGYLVRTNGVLVPFQATAALQLAACIPILLLCCTGPSRQEVAQILFPPPRDPIQWDISVSTVDFDGEHGAMERGRENLESSHDLILESSSILSSNEYFDC